MKAITNETILTFTVNATTTLQDFLGREDVQQAFGNMSVTQLLDLVEAYDDIDVSSCSQELKKDLTVTDLTEIELAISIANAAADGAINDNDTQPEAKPGLVSVFKAMDAIRDIPIVEGVTRVADIFSTSMANRFGTTLDNLFNMDILINDEKAATTSILYNGDEINISSPKAGTNGATDKVLVQLTDDAGHSFCIPVVEDTPLCRVWEAADSAGIVIYCLAIIESFNGEKLSSNPAIYNFSCNQLRFSEPMTKVHFTGDVLSTAEADEEEEEDSIGNTPVSYGIAGGDGDEDPGFLDDDEDPDFLDDGEDEDFFNDEDEEDELEYTTEDSSVYAGPARGVQGNVTVRYSISEREFEILNKITTLGSVIFSQRCLKLNGINEEQARGLRYTINDVVVTDFDTVLEIGDLIEISIQAAGKNGIC